MAVYDYIEGIPVADDLEEDGYLAGLARLALTPIQYAAETLDKPGRAIRGLLAGRPDELLNLLPFSDAVGITDPNKSVSGRDLLRQYGMVGEEDNWGNFFGGLGAEILLDPLNAMTLGTKGALTTAGKELAKTSGLAKTASQRIAKGQSGLFGARTPWITDMLGLPKASKPLLTGYADEALGMLEHLDPRYARELVEGGVDYLRSNKGGRFQAPGLDVVDDYGNLLGDSEQISKVLDKRSWGEYLAGPVVDDARGAIGKVPGGNLLLDIGDTTAAHARSAFQYGAGFFPHRKTTPILAASVRPAEDAIKALIDPLEAGLVDTVRQAYGKLGHLDPAYADDVVQGGIKLVHENAVPASVYAPGLDEAGRSELDALLRKASGQTTEIQDLARAEAIRRGVDVGNLSNPWGIPYLARQGQEYGGGIRTQQKERVFNDLALPGGQTQLAAMTSSPRWTGFGHASKPGQTGAGQQKAVKKQLQQNKADLLDQLKIRRDEMFPETTVKGYDQTTVVPENYGEDILDQLMNPKVDPPVEEVMPPPRIETRGRKKKVQALGELKGRSPEEDEFIQALLSKPKRTKEETELLELMRDSIKDDANQYSDEFIAPGRKRAGSLTPSASIASKELSALDELIAKEAVGAQPVLDNILTGQADSLDNRLGTDFTAKPVRAPSDEALKKAADDLAETLAYLNPEVVKAGKGVLRSDIIGLTTKYADNLAKQGGTAEGLLGVMAKNAKTRDDVLSSGSKLADYVPLNKLLSKAGLTGRDLVAGTKEVQQGGNLALLQKLTDEGLVSADVAANATTTGRIKKVLKNQMVPKDVAERVMKEAEGPGFQQAFGFGKVFEDATSAFRSFMTMPWVPYHVRNLYEGTLQSALGGGLSRRSLGDVKNYMSGNIKDAAKKAELDQLMAEAYSTSTAGRHQMLRQMSESALGKDLQVTKPWIDQTGSTARGTVTDFLQGYKPKEAAKKGQSYLTLNPEKNVLVQQGAQAGAVADDATRLSHFIELRRQGYDPQTAAQLTTTAHIDYSRLTPTERKLRQILPFYSFTKGNINRLAGQLQDPGPIASLLRTGTAASGDSTIPGYVSQGSAVPVPGGEEGKQRYLSGLSMPYDDEVLGALVDLARGNVRGAFRRGLTATSPIAKLPFALGTNTQLYSGRSLDEVTPSALTSLGGLLSPGTANVISETLSATPAGRLLSTANAVAGGKDENMLLKLLTGIRTTDVDSAMAEQYAAQDAAKQAALRSGMVSISERLYPKAQYRDAPPDELLRLMELIQNLQQRGQVMRQERAP